VARWSAKITAVGRWIARMSSTPPTAGTAQVAGQRLNEVRCYETAPPARLLPPPMAPSNVLEHAASRAANKDWGAGGPARQPRDQALDGTETIWALITTRWICEAGAKAAEG